MAPPIRQVGGEHIHRPVVVAGFMPAVSDALDAADPPTNGFPYFPLL